MTLRTFYSFPAAPCVSAAIFNAPAMQAGSSATVLAQGNNQFAVSLFQQVRSEPGNLFFSPHSLSTALAMTHTGARQQTATEMAAVLRSALPPTELPSAFAELARQLAESQRAGGAEFLLANSLWCQREYALDEGFTRTVRTDFGAQVEAVDFVQDPVGSAGRINTWVAQQTRDRIQDLIPPAAITPLTRLILANAIYFKGKWQQPFSPNATRPGTFHLDAGRTIEHPLMSRRSTARLLKQDAVKLLALPYQGGRMDMVILLPDAVDGLPALEAALTPDQLREWLTALSATRAAEVSVTLPRFKSTASLSLARTLARMGMPTAFDARTADFSAITGKPDLYISDVVHKAFVEVNEEGTEAAAATGVFMATRAAMTREFRADRPFLYLIRDVGTGSILFMGRLANPAG